MLVKNLPPRDDPYLVHTSEQGDQLGMSAVIRCTDILPCLVGVGYWVSAKQYSCHTYPGSYLSFLAKRRINPPPWAGNSSACDETRARNGLITHGPLLQLARFLRDTIRCLYFRSSEKQKGSRFDRPVSKASGALLVQNAPNIDGSKNAQLGYGKNRVFN